MARIFLLVVGSPAVVDVAPLTLEASILFSSCIFENILERSRSALRIGLGIGRVIPLDRSAFVNSRADIIICASLEIWGSLVCVGKNFADCPTLWLLCSGIEKV